MEFKGYFLFIDNVPTLNSNDTVSNIRVSIYSVSKAKAMKMLNVTF